MTDDVKRLIKKHLKRNLLIFRKVLGKNKRVKTIGKRFVASMFQSAPIPYYEVTKYYPTILEYTKQVSESSNFRHKPIVSIVMPTYNTNEDFLRECIESVLIQSYPYWELCIADDASSNKNVVRIIEEYTAKDSRVKLVVRSVNGHISEATNSALKIASGEYIALLDHDDVLWPNALYEIIKAINAHPEVDLLYTDEDKIDALGITHSYPFFKPDWSPEFLESCNYITHFACIRASLLKEVGGLRKGYEGAQDWDLFIRLTELTQQVHHIPKVLYSWRIHAESTAYNTDAKPYVYEAQRKLLEDHIVRRGEEGIVKQGIIKQHSSIMYKAKGAPYISIILLGSNPKSFRLSTNSLKRNTTYKNIEYICVTSNTKVTNFAKTFVSPKNLILYTHKQYVAACNKAANQAVGALLVFVDTTTVITNYNWLELLLGDAQKQGVGVVGGKTLNNEMDRIMRAAIGLGIYGLAAPLLEGMEVEDVHYLRGLYGQSRRNVAAVDGGCVMFKTVDFKKVKGFDELTEDLFIVDLCLSFMKHGLRNIYNPFVASKDLFNVTAGNAHDKRSKESAVYFKKKWKNYIKSDPYLNPSFTRTNAQLEII